MKHVFLLLLIGGLTVLISSNVGTRKFSVVGVGVEAIPTSYTGPCPGTIKFDAKIQADAPGRVKYTWLRSDGATGPVEFIDFPAAGVQHVSTTWTLGNIIGLPNFWGWEQVKILSPNDMLSNKAEFKLTCTK